MMKKNIFILIFIIISLGKTIWAQEVEQEKKLPTKVLYFSGIDMYIALTTPTEISKGDTLYLKATDYKEVLFVVIQSSSKHALLHPLAELIPLSIGQEIELFYSKVEKKQQLIFEEKEKKESILLSSIKKEEIKTERKLIVNGRVSAGINSLYSSTKWNKSQSDYINRFSAEPNTGFSLSVSQLPGNISLKINSRLDYRYSDYRPISPALQMRVYQFLIEKKMKKLPVLFRMGRFYNSNDSYSGFWDGALIEIGNYSSGMGIIAGTEPDQSSEGIVFSQPKLSIYTYFTQNWKEFKSRTEFSYTHLEPDFGFIHNYLGIRENIRLGKTRINLSFQLDRKPESGTWLTSYSYVNLSQPIGNSFLITARYSYRQPFRYWSSSPLGLVSHQYGTGLMWSGAKLRIGSDVFMNTIENGFQSKSLSTWFNLNEISPWKVNWNVNSSLWIGSSAFAVSASSSWSKQWESLWLSSGYQFNYSDYFNSISHTHGLFAQFQKTIKKLGTVNLRYSVDIGPLMLRSNLFVSFWKSF